MPIYGHIWLHVAIYIYIPLDLAGLVLVVPSGHECSTLHPNVRDFGSDTPPLLTILCGTGLTEVFIWTVWSFNVFGGQLDWTCVFITQTMFFEKY